MQEVARRVKEEPVFSVLGGAVSIIESPEEITEAEYMIATNTGGGLIIWPDEIDDYLCLLEAWRRALRHDEQAEALYERDPEDDEDVDHSGLLPGTITTPISNGDHSCWDHMREMGLQGGGPRAEDTTIIQELLCQECGHTFYRHYRAVSVANKDGSWAG